MKRYFLIAAIACLSVSCKKNNDDDAGIPAGIWVDKARPLDTLVAYRENGKNILFDNSEMYRANPNRSTAKEYAKWKYNLIPGRISIKNYPQLTDDYQTYEFVWTIEGKEFSMQANAIRPYLSSIFGKLVYVKIQ